LFAAFSAIDLRSGRSKSKSEAQENAAKFLNPRSNFFTDFKPDETFFLIGN
jgi:hypothetical protein